MDNLQEKYDALVNQVAEMLKEQAEYFAQRKRGYSAEHQLAKKNKIEAKLRETVKAAIKERTNPQASLF